MAKAKKQRKRFYGISTYAIALVYEGRTLGQERDAFCADNPSAYTEARLGVSTRAEAEKAFEETIDAVINGAVEAPMLKKWADEIWEKERRVLSFGDLEARIQRKNKTKALVTSSGIGKPNYSSQGTLVIPVKSRTTARDDDTLSFWDVNMGNFEISERGLNPMFWRICQCGFDSKTKNKRRLWENIKEERKFLEDLLDKGIIIEKDVRRPLDLVCYHKALAATYLELVKRGQRPKIKRLDGDTTIPFDFIDNWVLVFEDMARKYRYRQDMAERDAFLWQHDIISDEFKEYMKKGIVNKEVIKGKRFFDPMAKKIIMAIYERMHSQGYKFRGFSREFIGFKNKSKSRGYENDYEAVGMVFEKDKPDKSYRVVYAPGSKINLPIIVEKTHVNPELRQLKPRKYQRHPLRLCVDGKMIPTLDDRTNRVVETRVFIPTANTLRNIYRAEKEYTELLKYFKDHSPRKRKK